MKRIIGFSTRGLSPGGFFYISIFILLISFGFIFLSQTVWDYDFWWHIATGKYIVETKSIPNTDPFSFTSQMAENSNLYPDREKFILTQYWLAQVVMYFLYQNAGPAGIVILRFILLLGAMYVIYRALKDRGVMPYIIYLSLFLAACNIFRFFGDRPVLFTISLSVICFVMVDDYVRKRSRAFYFLPFLMLVWANLHGGFILGIVIILVFLVTECVKLLLRQSSFSSREKIIFFMVLFSAIGVSGINPNGFFAFEIAFSDTYAPFYVGIQEYQSPFFLYKNNYAPPDYGYLAALLLFPIVLVLRNRKFNPSHLILLVLLAVQSLSAIRFTIYYGLIASLVLGNEFDLWLKQHNEKFVVYRKHLNIAFSIVMLISSILYLSAVVNLNVFKMRDSRWIVPKETADFIKTNNIKGNMLNDMATGGYLAWRLYPEVKTFIDTRALNYTVMREYALIGTATESIYNRSLPPGRTPLWKRLLEHYKINVIVFSPLDIYGNTLPLIIKLLDDDDWVPVSAKVMAVVFVKNVPENKPIIEKFRIIRDKVYNTIIVRALLTAQTYRDSPHYMESLGDMFLKMGRKDDAIKAYEYSLKRMSDNPRVREKLDKVLKENEEGNYE